MKSDAELDAEIAQVSLIVDDLIQMHLSDRIVNGDDDRAEAIISGMLGIYDSRANRMGLALMASIAIDRAVSLLMERQESAETKP